MPIENRPRAIALLRKGGINPNILRNGSFDERKLALEKLDLFVKRIRSQIGPNRQQDQIIAEYESLSKKLWLELYEDIIKREA
jgi:hypothetical protein